MAKTTLTTLKQLPRNARLAYGGKMEGHSKEFRPMDPKRPLYIVLKSIHAKGAHSLLNHQPKIDELIKKWGDVCDITVLAEKNAGNHLHLLVSLKSKPGMQKFLRVVPALIARSVTNSAKGRPFGKRFWDEAAFTRIITDAFDRKDPKAADAVLKTAIEQYKDVTKQAKKEGTLREYVLMDQLKLKPKTPAK